MGSAGTRFYEKLQETKLFSNSSSTSPILKKFYRQRVGEIQLKMGKKVTIWPTFKPSFGGFGVTVLQKCSNKR
jgi:hypothetical protein